MVFVGARVTIKETKLKMKKFAYESLLRVGHNSCASLRKVIEVKDNWVNSRATMNTGAAGHVMPAVQQMEKISKSWVRKPYHSSPVEGVHRCIKFRSANVVKPLISMRKAGNVMVLDEKNPHIRNTWDGTVIKLDANNGGYTTDMWCVSMKLVRFSAGKDSEWLECHKQTSKTKDEVQQ